MKAPKLQTIIICSILFLLFLLFAFPFQNLKGMIFGKIHQATKILIVAEDIHPSFFGWPGIRIENVNVTLPVGDNEIEVAAKTLLFRVGLKGLFPPVPAVSLSLEKLEKGGDLFIKVGKNGNSALVTLESDKVNLEQLNLPWIAETIPGTIDAEIDAKVDQNDLSKSNINVSINGKDLKTPNYMVELPGTPFQIPGMKVGTLEIKLQTRNGSIEFQTFKFGSNNSDLKGALTGDIRLGKTLQQTTINLTLRIQVSKQISDVPQNATFFQFLNPYQTVNPGEYAMKWNATIQEMMGITRAIPEKVGN